MKGNRRMSDFQQEFLSGMAELIFKLLSCVKNEIRTLRFNFVNFPLFLQNKKKLFVQQKGNSGPLYVIIVCSMQD